MAHGFDLPFEAIKSAKSGQVSSNAEVVRHGSEPGQELRVDGLDSSENTLTNCFVNIKRLGVRVDFRHMVHSSIQLVFRYREGKVPPRGSVQH